MRLSKKEDIAFVFKPPEGAELLQVAGGSHHANSLGCGAPNVQSFSFRRDDGLTLEISHCKHIPEIWEIWLLETQNNKDLLPHWEQFLKDFSGMPVKRACKLQPGRPPLIVLADAGPLSQQQEKQLLAFVREGSGLIVTGKPPKIVERLFGIKRCTSFADNVMTCRNDPAIAPLDGGTVIPFAFSFFPMHLGEPIMLAVADRWAISRGLRWLFRKLMVAASLLPFFHAAAYNVYCKLVRMAVQLHFFSAVPVVTRRQYGRGKILCWGFEPLAMLRNLSRQDESPVSGAAGAWLVKPLLSCIVDTAEALFVKPFWHFPGVPLIYSIDTEATIFDWDFEQEHCSDPRAVASEEYKDTKLSQCLRKCAQVLERHGLIGTFHLCTGGIHDDEDRRAVAEVATRHEIAVHMGHDGSHEVWRRNCGDVGYVRANLAEAAAKIEMITGKRPAGIRYPAWQRKGNTHDVVAQLGFVYDSSSWAGIPYCMVPFRMAAHEDGLPLRLWELPCMENWEIVKKRRGMLNRLGGYWMSKVMRHYLQAAVKHGSPVVICDHDMGFGVDDRHLHKSGWQLHRKRFDALMRWLQEGIKQGYYFPTTASEFMRHYVALRATQIASIDVSQVHKGQITLHLQVAANKMLAGRNITP